jgi:hypothetical protein
MSATHGVHVVVGKDAGGVGCADQHFQVLPLLSADEQLQLL